MYMYSHTDKFYTLYIDRNQFNMDKFIIKVINRTYIWLYMCIWQQPQDVFGKALIKFI